MCTPRKRKIDEVNQGIIQVDDCYVDLYRTPIKRIGLKSISPVLCLQKLDLNSCDFHGTTINSSEKAQMPGSQLLLSYPLTPCKHHQCSSETPQSTPASLIESHNVDNQRSSLGIYDSSDERDLFAAKSFYREALTNVSCPVKYSAKSKAFPRKQKPHAMRVLIKQSPKHPKSVMVHKNKRTSSKGDKVKKMNSAYMKKSLLWNSLKDCTSETTPGPASNKRKFFTNSQRGDRACMTTLIFGKRRLLAPLTDKNTSKSSKDQQKSNISSAASVEVKDSQNAYFKNVQHPFLSKPDPASGSADFLDLMDSESTANQEDVFPVGEVSNMTKESPIKSTCLQLSNGAISTGTKTPSTRSRKSLTQMCLQHYYYDPSLKENIQDDQLKNYINEHGSQKSFNLFDSSDSEEADDVYYMVHSNHDETLLDVTVEQFKAKPTNMSWPIRYLAKKEHLSKSLMRTTKKKFDKSCNSLVNAKEQLIIDAGQKNVGAQLCSECGMLYSSNSAEDMAVHYKVHNNAIISLRFMGWKRERVIREYHDGKVILILPEDSKFALRKVDDVKQVMDVDLGFHAIAQPNDITKQTFLFVAVKKIVGCLIAEAIKQAFRIVPNPAGPPSCSTVAEPAVCGINRIWTLATHRRRKIATRLMDCMRTAFYYGCEVTVDQIAFSDPTPNGQLFAARYTNSEDFLVYK